MSYYDVRMAFGRISDRDRFVVYIGIIDGAVAIESDRRIGALRLRMTCWNQEFIPCDTGSRTERAALLTAALFRREPYRPIRRNTDVSMQTGAIASAAVV